MQLQIVKPIHIHHHNHNHNSNQYQYSLKQTRNHDNTHDKLKHLFKYKVISDHNSFHLLSVYVQGKQDEGTYQCVDSKSETPIKKTIKLFLSKLFFLIYIFVLMDLIFFLFKFPRIEINEIKIQLYKSN